MRILWNELKKILSWKILLLLAIVNSILYLLFIGFYIDYFPNGRPALDHYQISIEMLDKYGMDIDDEEFADFKEIYAVEVKKVDAFLQTKSEYVDAGLGSYQDLNNSEAHDNNKKLDELRWNLYDEEIGDTLWGLQAREYFIEWIEDKEASLDGWFDRPVTTKQQARMDELKQAKQFPIFTGEVLTNYQDFIFYVAIAIIISIIIAISPIYIKDRSSLMLDMQYITKKGRNLYKVKVVAGIISTFIVITALFIIYLSIYSLNNTSMFFDLPMHKFIGPPSWYDPTFLQYIMLTVVGVYILGLITALFAMSFSSIVPNYISLIGIQIPYVFLIISLGLNYLVSRIISINLPALLVPTTYGVLVVVSTLFMAVMWKREKRRDIIQ